MILRQDHIAGGIFVVAGIAVFAMSGDLPLGSMAMPGAGMMPKLVLGLMVVFGLVLMVRAGESPPFATIAWNDLPLDYLDTWTRQVDRVTIADIKAAFGRKLQPQRMVTVTLGAAAPIPQ